MPFAFQFLIAYRRMTCVNLAYGSALIRLHFARCHWHNARFAHKTEQKLRTLGGFLLAANLVGWCFSTRRFFMAVRKCEHCGNAFWSDNEAKSCALCGVAMKTETKTTKPQESNERQLEAAAR